MKKILILALFLVTIFSCTDLTGIQEQLNSHSQRLDDLESFCAQLNTNITSLNSIVSVLENNDYVKEVSPIILNSKQVGYTISFTKSKPINIYNGLDGSDGEPGLKGQNGNDGHSPVIGIKQYTDGVYYWTLDGRWLLDERGKKIKAEGPKGNDGIIPRLRIMEGYWEVSYDGGSKWDCLGKATGEKGDSFFKNIDNANEEYLLITLTDGTEIKLPKWSEEKFDVKFSNTDKIFCEAGNTVQVTFEVRGTDFFKVDCLGENGWQASVNTNGNKGTISIVAPSPYVDGKILVFVSDSKGRVLVNSLTFTDQMLIILSGDTYKIKNTSSNLKINVRTTTSFTVSMTSETQSWVHIVQTKATTRDEVISFNIDENKLYHERVGIVKLESDKGNIIREIKIIQEGAFAPCKAVDLGLSVKWSNTNLGATKPEEKGKLYLWGDPKDEGYNGRYQAPNINNICGTEYDTATYLLGADWRMPTRAEQTELIRRCDWIRTMQNGVSGMKVIGPNGNSIFLPLTGIGMPSSGPANQDNTQLTFTDGGYFWVGESYPQMNSGTYAKGRFGYVFYFNSESYYYDGSWNTQAVRISIRPVCVK